MESVNTVRAYGCRVRGRDVDFEEIINARTAGKAKQEFLINLDGCYPDIKFTDIRCRVAGPPQTSRQFTRNAEYRGVPHVKCGDRVTVGEARGVIVGHNSSANFDVLFDNDSPKYAGLRLNVHPDELKLL